MQLEVFKMTKAIVTVLLVFLTCFSEYNWCAFGLECQKCNTTLDTTSCKYGGKVIIDRDDECKPGKTTCYRIQYIQKCNKKTVYSRGCDDANFCQKQNNRNDIDVKICEQCDSGTYCNSGSLFS